MAETMRVVCESMDCLKSAIYYAECDMHTGTHRMAVKAMETALARLEATTLKMAKTDSERRKLANGEMQASDYDS